MAESLMARLERLEPAFKELWIGQESQETLTDLIREYRAATEILYWEHQEFHKSENCHCRHCTKRGEWLERNGVKR